MEQEKTHKKKGIEAWIGKRFHAREKKPTLEERVQRLENLLLAPKELPTDAVSQEKIEQLVESLLADPATNLSIVPDFLERKLDRRILQLLLGVISKGLTTATVDVCDGHVLKLSLVPEQPLTPSDGPAPVVSPTSLDGIVFTALQTFFSTLKINLLGHTILFQLE